jgi:hypothetical protein
MEHAPAARGRGYYATRTAVRAAVYAVIATAFMALPGTGARVIEHLVNGLGL